MPELVHGGARTYYRELGAGAPLLLLHAGGSAGGQWDRLAAALSGERRTLVPDLYGHGLSPCPADMTPEALLDRQTDVLLALLAGAGPAWLIGHSYGAVVALRLAVRAPEAVAGLVLIEPVALGLLAPDDAALAAVLAVEAECRALVLAGDSTRATRRFLEFWSEPELWDILPDREREAIVAGARERHFIGGPAIFSAGPDLLLSPTAPPPLVITGDEGPAAPRVVADRLLAALPGAHRLTLPGAGHMLPLTHHRSLLRALLPILRPS